MNKQTLVIIPGASKGIGQTFLNHYKKQENTKVIGINRTGIAGQKLDLMNEDATYEFVKNLDLSQTANIIYLHSVGIMKFEPEGKPHIDRDHDGIDDEVHASNYLTLVNLVEPLIEKTNKLNVPMTLCNIGSLSDIHAVPYWQSFSRTKNKVRQFCKTIREKNISSLVLNVSTTVDNKEALYGRTQADMEYKQSTQELLEKSINIIDGFHKKGIAYAEFDFYKHNPAFRTDHYTNLPKLYAQWAKDMGYEGKEIPQGIRI